MEKEQKHCAKGFTLVELMIAVAIIGVLAAIAIPQYTLFIVRSKRTEAVTLANNLFKGEISYFAEYDHFTQANIGTPVPLDSDAINQALGFGPIEETPRFRYKISFAGNMSLTAIKIDLACEVTNNCEGLNRDLDGDPFPDAVVIFTETFTGGPWLSKFSPGIPHVYKDDIANVDFSL